MAAASGAFCDGPRPVADFMWLSVLRTAPSRNGLCDGRCPGYDAKEARKPAYDAIIPNSSRWARVNYGCWFYTALNASAHSGAFVNVGRSLRLETRCDVHDVLYKSRALQVAPEQQLPVHDQSRRQAVVHAREGARLRLDPDSKGHQLPQQQHEAKAVGRADSLRRGVCTPDLLRVCVRAGGRRREQRGVQVPVGGRAAVLRRRRAAAAGLAAGDRVVAFGGGAT